MRRVVPACALATLVLAGCATPPPAADRDGPRLEPPSLGFFSPIKVPDGQEPTLKLNAKGVQIFRCERIGSAFEWRFRQPEAELFDSQGQATGRHGANFSFEHRDRSRLLAAVVAHERTASADTLPWLLLSAKSYGDGAFAGVSYVQRVNTRGGMPPANCTAGQANRLLRVDFSAEFVFYRPRG